MTQPEMWDNIRFHVMGGTSPRAYAQGDSPRTSFFDHVKLGIANSFWIAAVVGKGELWFSGITIKRSDATITRAIGL